jgi:hypothetical protein
MVERCLFGSLTSEYPRPGLCDITGIVQRQLMALYHWPQPIGSHAFFEKLLASQRKRYLVGS